MIHGLLESEVNQTGTVNQKVTISKDFNTDEDCILSFMVKLT